MIAPALLLDSLYNPCSDFHGEPIKHLGGNAVSFVYFDYGQDLDKLENELGGREFTCAPFGN